MRGNVLLFALGLLFLWGCGNSANHEKIPDSYPTSDNVAFSPLKDLDNWKEPQEAWQWRLKGKILLQEQNFAQARTAFLNAWQKDRKVENALRLAQLYISVDSLDQALRWAQEAWGHSPIPEAAYYKAFALARQGLNNQALIWLNKPQVISWPGAPALKAHIFQLLGEEDSAWHYLRMAVQQQPKNPSLAFTFEKLFAQKAQWDSALYYNQKAMPNMSSKSQMEALKRQLRYGVANNVVDTVLANMHSWAQQQSDSTLIRQLWKATAYSLWQANQNREVEALLPDLKQMAASDTAMQLLMARWADHRYRYHDAAKQYQELLTDYPNFEIAQQELEAVQRKIAYLQKREELKKQQDSTRQALPEKIDNLSL